MTLTKFSHAKIVGISTVVPEKEINIYDEAQYYGNSIKKIDRMRKMVGFHKRRVADNTTTASDLGICAARNLIKEMDLDVSTIDAIVNVVQKPDFDAPASAYFIHQKLGLSQNAPAFDINNGCSGFVYGMWVVSQMIESGANKRILLVCADTPSVGIDIADRNSAPLFGDAGSAILVDYSEEEINSYYNIETLSEGFEAIINPFVGYRFRIDFKDENDVNLLKEVRNRTYISSSGSEVSYYNGHLDGISVFDFTINFVPQNLSKCIEYAGLKNEDIHTLCLHQANKQIVEGIANAINMPLEKAPYYAFENYGNNTMCSIPTTLCSVLKETTENEKITIAGCGFGNGLTSASCVLTLDKIFNTGVKEYVRPEYYKTREEFINYWDKKIKGE